MTKPETFSNVWDAIADTPEQAPPTFRPLPN